ncbi:MAG: hypothetical protein KJS92_03195 [Bacteroidetes bacterium]|nr:hypothetical protein [Bacteroidota bacterium]
MAARARKKSLRYWIAGSVVSLMLILGAVLLWQADAGGEARQANANDAAKPLPAVSEKNARTASSASEETSIKNNQDGAFGTEPISSAKSGNSGKYVSKPDQTREWNAVLPVSAKQGGWTVYPPLSALDKPLNTPETELFEVLYGKWFGLLPARNKKPDAASKSAYNSGFRPVHNDWLIEVLADPARMQLYSASTSYNKMLNRTEHQQAAMQAVIRAGKQIGNNVRWFVGLKWSEQRSHFNYDHTVSQSATVVDVLQVTIREPGLPDRQIAVHDTHMLHTQVNANYSSVNRMRMIGIPLGLQFAPAGKSGSLYVFGSLMPAYVLNTSGMRVQPDGTVAYMESAGYMRRFQLNTELGLGMRKTLAQGLFLTLEPRFSYGLLNLSLMSVRQQGINVGMSVGLSFRPGR